MKKRFRNAAFLTLAFLLVSFTSGSALKIPRDTLINAIASNSKPRTYCTEWLQNCFNQRFPRTVHVFSEAPPASTIILKRSAASTQANKAGRMICEALPSTFSNYVTSIQSNNDTDRASDYVKLTSDGNTIHIEGKDSKATEMSARIYDDSGFFIFFKGNIHPAPNGLYSFNIATTPPDGNYLLTVIRITHEKSTTHQTPVYVLPVTFKDGKFLFPMSPVYENNLDKINHAASCDTLYDDLTYSQVNKVVQLSNQICSGLTDDYSKLLALHNWVTKNIYYDYDAYNSGYDDGNGYRTLVTKRGVCSGYATLYEMLCEAQGLDVYEVGGLAACGYDDFSDLNGGHAWNLAYVNGNWMNIDTTWDTTNKYIKGSFVAGDRNNHYFNCTNEWFADDHRIDVIFKINAIQPTFDTPVYSTAAPTRNDVTVTVNVADSVKPTLSHTFKANGSYTFTAKDAHGNTASTTVRVSNIDRTPPDIDANVRNNKKTHSAVTVTVDDTNLASKSITLNGKAIKWGSGTFTKKGRYFISATDKAGNKSTYAFTIY